ncbi:MAG: protein kinase [Myxococcales bacterium]|nr:protein kinase [Myxococcales bacterium]
MSLYVDELFEELSRLSEADRERLLTSRCVDHPDIEAEVRALLSAHADGQDSGEPVAVEPGAMLGRYRLEELLGEGATASVWRAWDTQLESYTALKLLHRSGGLQGDSALEAVLHEARAASGIISDHVVRIKTAGRFDGGPHFIEMELCAETRPGPDGSEVLEIGRSLSEVALRSPEEKARVMAEAARGVDVAHRMGVLHRDLKPGNILITPVGRRAKVTDFGLAADQLYPAPTPSTAAHRTVTVLLEAQDGKVVGTPAYMPVEQAFGQPPTRATDVYALGATLYALLTGDHPYVPKPGASVPALDVLAQVREGPPVPVQRVIRVPRRLARIVARAMARSARNRYPTAAAFADDLDAWRQGFATSVDGPAPLLRTALFVGRHRTVVTSVAVLGLCVFLFMGVLGWMEVQRQVLQGKIARAQAELQLSMEDAEHADRVRAQAVHAAEEARSTAEAAKRLAAEARREADDVTALAQTRVEEAETAQADAEQQRDEALVARQVAEEAAAAADEARDRKEAERAAAVQQALDAEQATALAQQQHREASAQLADARATLAQRELALGELQGTLEREQSRVRLLQRDLTDLEAEIERESGRRQHVEEELRQVSERLAKRRAEVRRLKEALDAEQGEQGRLLGQIDRLVKGLSPSSPPSEADNRPLAIP